MITFQVAEGKLPADCLVAYLPFSPMKVLRKIYSIEKFGVISIYFFPKTLHSILKRYAIIFLEVDLSHHRRFYAPVDLLEKSEIAVDGEEARHAFKVLRIREGEKVSILNGKGEEVFGIVEKADKERLLIKELGKVKVHSPPTPKISLLIGMSEIAALEEALLHCAELGLWKFCPVFTKYSVTKPQQIEKKLERFQKIAISAIKQSGFPFLPKILIFKELDEAIKTLPQNGFLFSQDGEKRLSEFGELQNEITFAIGPEGDFSEEEKKLFLEHNYKKAKLSNYTLRVETAAITALAQAKRC